jgi:hypothetical protein
MNSQQTESEHKMPIVETVHLIDHVNYQEGADVSRTLLHHTKRTVTLFAFDEGQGSSEPTSLFDRLPRTIVRAQQSSDKEVKLPLPSNSHLSHGHSKEPAATVFFRHPSRHIHKRKGNPFYR